MKKLNFALLLALALSAVLISCGGGGGGGGGGSAPATTDSSTTTTTSTSTTSTSTTTSSTTTTTTTPTPTLAAPTIQVPTGKALLSGSKIGITTSVAGATIYYTLDGTEPTSSSSVYTSSKVTISSACTLKAIAIKDGVSSSIASATYSIAARKNAPDAELDIVFKNGTATAYTTDLYLTEEFQQDAIAMIFYKGADCSDNGLTRILGVGLKYSASTMGWCLSSANANNNNITTIQDNVKNGSQNLTKIGAWLAANSFIDDTGTESNYPAFYWAKNYGTSNGTFASGWYLPSKTELQKVYVQRAVLDAVVAECGLNNTFSSITLLWTSTQNIDNRAGADAVSFITGHGLASKSLFSVCNVCAIREF